MRLIPMPQAAPGDEQDPRSLITLEVIPMQCPECGHHEAADDVRFCPNCGFPASAKTVIRIGADSVEITDEDGNVTVEHSRRAMS